MHNIKLFSINTHPAAEINCLSYSTVISTNVAFFHFIHFRDPSKDIFCFHIHSQNSTFQMLEKNVVPIFYFFQFPEKGIFNFTFFSPNFTFFSPLKKVFFHFTFFSPNFTFLYQFYFLIPILLFYTNFTFFSPTGNVVVGN